MFLMLFSIFHIDLKLPYFSFQLFKNPRNTRDCFHPGVRNIAPIALQTDQEIGAARILKTMISYVWPKDQPGLRARVILALCLLLGAKVCTLYIAVVNLVDLIL